MSTVKKGEAYYGRKMHEILNNTLHRKLTREEYLRLVENIQNMLVACRIEQKNILVEIMEKHPVNSL